MSPPQNHLQPGQSIPDVPVKEDSPAPTTKQLLPLKGKNVIVGVPGAFTGTCHAQVPKYMKALSNFQAKGVNKIFIVSVNDVFVMKAWKENLSELVEYTGNDVHFIADDDGSFTKALGLSFDASPNLGSPRSWRYAIVATDGKIDSVTLEEDATKLTVTDAQEILAKL